MIVGGDLLAKPQSRRVMILNVSATVLVGLFSLNGKQLVRILGMPFDARILNVSYRFDRGEVSFLIESNTFDEVPDGSAVSTIDLECLSIDLDWLQKQDSKEV